MVVLTDGTLLSVGGVIDLLQESVAVYTALRYMILVLLPSIMICDSNSLKVWGLSQYPLQDGQFTV